jgi:hypothetical protein
MIPFPCMRELVATNCGLLISVALLFVMSLDVENVSRCSVFLP